MIRLEDIIIDPEFRDFLPTVEDASLLRGKIELEGWSDEPITVWENHCILLDGHRRYEIWKERGDDGPPIREMKFATREAAEQWVSINQRAKRNLTPEQETCLMAKQYKAEVAVKGGDNGLKRASKKPKDQSGLSVSENRVGNPTRKLIAERHGVGEGTIKRAVDYDNAADNLDKRGVVSKSDLLSGVVKVPKSKVIEAAKAETNEEAKAVIESIKTKKEECPTINANEENTERQGPLWERAITAKAEVLNFLQRSKLVRLGKNNPHAEYAFDEVIRWLRSQKKEMTNG